MKSQDVKKINQQLVIVVLREMYNITLFSLASCCFFLLLTAFFLFPPFFSRFFSFFFRVFIKTLTTAAKKEVRPGLRFGVVVQSE
jgi:hypothetical protein